MKPKNRQNWIIEWLKKHSYAVDVLNADFEREYETETNTNFKQVHRQLGSDLSFLYKCGVLERKRITLADVVGTGFPNWIWSYEMKLSSKKTLPILKDDNR